MKNPGWKIELKRKGKWWTWTANSYDGVGWGTNFWARRSRESAQKAACRFIANTQERGVERFTVTDDVCA